MDTRVYSTVAAHYVVRFCLVNIPGALVCLTLVYARSVCDFRGSLGEREGKGLSKEV